MSAVSSFYLGLLLLIAYTILAIYAFQPLELNALDDNENDVALMQKRPSFFVGSRYGRSPQVYASKSRRLNVAPRNDRFFPGSRYGKRADEFSMPAYEQTDSSSLPLSSTNLNNKSTNGSFMMSCIYTGVRNFYRCSTSDEINNVLNHLSNGQTDDDK